MAEQVLVAEEVVVMVAPARWDLAPRLPAEQLACLDGVHPLVVQILHNRGIREPGEVKSFLSGAAGRLEDPFLLKGMAEAVERIARAIERRDLIVVYGDFDADGVTSTALLTEAIAALGGRVMPFIPQREEGYGLNVRTLACLAGKGARLVVTVDCGVSSAVEVEAARALGLDVVITDHHRVTGPLPAAVAVVNPRQADCPYPFKALAGVGVAFKLAQALFSSVPLSGDRSAEELERALLDLVALGTVADVVPLLGENRVLACRGLVELNRTARPGLRELIRTAGLRPGEIGSWEIAYSLGPRLNAAGRLGDANVSYRLLVCKADEAGRLAQTLESANRERQQLTEEMLSLARQEVLPQLPEAKLLVVAGPEYPPGILGLVAGRLTEEFYRPAVVIGIQGDEARGSARSIAEFDLAAALVRCGDLLVRFGGHPRAGGFTVEVDRLDDLRARLQALAEEDLRDCELKSKLSVDAELNLRGVNWALHQEIQRIAPFGYENPVPLFLSRGLRVLTCRVVGQHAPGHLKLTLSDGATRWGAIGFGYGALASLYREGALVDLVYHLEADAWEGNRALQLRIKGIQPSA